MKKQKVDFLASLGEKVRNRHSNESGVVASLCLNASGSWYYVETTSGMSIGWWHETDLAGAPKSMPSTTKRAEEQQQSGGK